MHSEHPETHEGAATAAPVTPSHLLPLNYHGAETRAVVFGKICCVCAGPLFVPKRGPVPDTCSPKCRKAKSRGGDR